MRRHLKVYGIKTVSEFLKNFQMKTSTRSYAQTNKLASLKFWDKFPVLLLQCNIICDTLM
jgi:hypothetical protein